MIRFLRPHSMPKRFPEWVHRIRGEAAANLPRLVRPIGPDAPIEDEIIFSVRGEKVLKLLGVETTREFATVDVTKMAWEALWYENCGLRTVSELIWVWEFLGEQTWADRPRQRPSSVKMSKPSVAKPTKGTLQQHGPRKGCGG